MGIKIRKLKLIKKRLKFTDPLYRQIIVRKTCRLSIRVKKSLFFYCFMKNAK